MARHQPGVDESDLARGPLAPALLVQRSAVLSLTLRQALHDIGLGVLSHHTVHQALARLDADRPSIVLACIESIGHKDLEVVAALSHATPAPLVVVSMGVASNESAQVLEAGADDHVFAWTGRSELAARLRAKMRRARGFPGWLASFPANDGTLP